MSSRGFESQRAMMGSIKITIPAAVCFFLMVFLEGLNAQTVLSESTRTIPIFTSDGQIAEAQIITNAPFGNYDLFTKVPKTSRRKSRWHLDRDIKIMAGIHGGAELADGITTWGFSHQKLYYPEATPISRFFIGEKPGSPSGIARMGVFGTAENLGAAYLSQWMRHSRHKFWRVISYGLQPVGIGLHLHAAARNISQDYSLCNHGDHYNGNACVPNP